MRAPLVGLAAALLLTPALAAGNAAAAPPTDRGKPLPDRIELPRGWQPEGITTDGRKLYVGSLAWADQFFHLLRQQAIERRGDQVRDQGKGIKNDYQDGNGE